MSKRLFFAVWMLSWCGAAVAATEQWTDASFSAKVVRTQPGTPPLVTTGRMYVGPDGIRTESTQFGQSVWMIFRPAKKLVWTLFPDQKTFFERKNYLLERPPLPDEPGSPCRNPAFYCEKVGDEWIDGRPVVHWRVVLRGALGDKQRGNQGGTSHADLWIDPRLKLAITEKYADGLTVEMQQIREGVQEPFLFQVPEGFHKAAAPGEVDATRGQPPH